MSENYDRQLIRIIKSEVWLMDSLKEVRKLNLPDWYIAAGTIRNTVWNNLHGFPGDSNSTDIDVVYFDNIHIEKEREKQLERTLTKINPLLKWEVKNQARKEIMNPKVKSSCESIAYWIETPTCVGARLEQDDSITICAPHGLDDLMNLVIRPVPGPYLDRSLYERRITEKQWDKVWPKLKNL